MGLVDIAAFIPDQGESAVGLLSQAPAANKDMRATKDDFLYLEPAAFPADFAADVPPVQANFMAHSQPMLAKAMARKPIVMALDMPVRDHPVAAAIGARNTGSANIAPIATQPSSPPAATMTQR